eukprot:6009124-Pleurochrysis_carterae.AAC.2
MGRRDKVGEKARRHRNRAWLVDVRSDGEESAEGGRVGQRKEHADHAEPPLPADGVEEHGQEERLAHQPLRERALDPRLRDHRPLVCVGEHLRRAQRTAREGDQP